jgi:hypothetical protein
MKTTWLELATPPRRCASLIHRSTRWLTAGLFAAALLGAASPAAAQTKADLKRAHTLFNEGIALSAANNWSGALAKFKEVAQVKMTAQVAFNIAECEENLGKLLSALGNYRLASNESQDGKAKDVAAQVDGRINALQERIPKLTIQRGERADAATIELDGAELGSTEVGTAISVDPGTHVVVGKIGKTEGARETVTLEERDSKTVTIVIDASLVKKPERPVDPGPIEPPKPPPDTGGSKVPGAVVTGIGAASLGVGVAFIVLRQGTIDDLDTLCGGDESCPPSAEETADKGRLFTGVAQATIALGVVGVATGIILLATSGGKSAPTDESTPTETGFLGLPKSGRGVGFLGVAPGASLGGVSLMGRF